MLKNSDIEKLYNRIGGHIDLVGSHTGIENICSIIKTCRLKPYSIFTGQFRNSTTYENHWVDEFGNSLLIENKIPRIIIGDTGISKNTQIGSDLFFGHGIQTTMENGKAAFISTGNYNGSDFIMSAIYGDDEYLRAFIRYGKWYRVSPLYLGLNTIRTILKATNNKHPIEIDKKALDAVLKFDMKRCVLIPLKTKDIPMHFRVVMNSII